MSENGQEAKNGGKALRDALDSMPHLSSLRLYLGAEGKLRLAVIPFLGFLEKPNGPDGSHVLQEIARHPAFEDAIATLGLERQGFGTLTVDCFQNGVHRPAPGALARAIDEMMAGACPVRSNRLRKRLQKALKAGPGHGTSKCTLPVAIYRAETDWDLVRALRSLRIESAELFETKSLEALDALAAFDELVSRCLVSRQMVTLSGLEAFMLEHHADLLSVGYRFMTGFDVTGALKRIYGKKDALQWQLRSLADGAGPELSFTPEPGSPIAPSKGESPLGLPMACGRDRSEEFALFSKLGASMIRSLDTSWAHAPHLQSSEEKAVVVEAAAALARVSLSRVLDGMGAARFWLARYALHRSLLGFESRESGLEERMRFLKARDEGSFFCQLCIELLPTESRSKVRLLLRRQASVDAEGGDLKVTVAPGCEWPEYELLTAKDSSALSGGEHPGALVTESGRYFSPLSALAEGVLFSDQAPSASDVTAFEAHWPMAPGYTLAWGRFDMIAESLAIVKRTPALFGNLSFLRHGHVSCSDATLTRTTSKPFLVEPWALTVRTSQGWRDPYPVLGAGPQILRPGHSPKGLGEFTERVHRALPLDMVDVEAQERARLKMTYVPLFQSERARQIFGGPADGRDPGAWGTESVVRLMRDLARKLRDDKLASADPQSSEQPGAPSGYEDLVAEFGNLELEPRFEFEIGEEVVSQTEWEAAKRHKQGYLVGGRVYLSRAQYEACLEVYVLRKKALARFSKLRVVDLWRSLGGFAASKESSLRPAEYLEQLQVNLEPILELMNRALPETILEEFEDASSPLSADLKVLKAELRHYQKYGTAWLLSRVDAGLGALLGDDMGLGKTVQATALMVMLRQRSLRRKAPCKPILIVCPKSLVPNWNHELRRFLPVAEGASAKGAGFQIATLTKDDIDASADILITTYSRLRLRLAELAQAFPEWGLVVLDEAHTIKNSDTQICQSVADLVCDKRIALTGTPVENHAGELWSIVDWLNPGLLGKEGDFKAYTKLARSSAEKKLMLSPVHEILKPVFLRRLKSDPAVGLELPDKIHKTIRVELTEEQRILYETIVLAAIDADLGTENTFQARSRFMTATLRLKQICNHPEAFWSGEEEDEILNNRDSLGHIESKKLRALIKKRSQAKAKESVSKGSGNGSLLSASFVERSGKFEALIGLLEDLRENDGGILVFTQFRQSALQIERALQSGPLGPWAEVAFLHGGLSTAQRDALVSHFQSRCAERRALRKKGEEPQQCPPLLIISLRAGGVGLNLTGANQVIHYDRWWNPAVEDQATDRAHRMGQDQRVVVTHFCSEGTIEEGLMARLDEKRSLANDLIGMASQESFGETLQDLSGFLKLVDPYGNFRGRVRVPGAALRVAERKPGVETEALVSPERDKSDKGAKAVKTLRTVRVKTERQSGDWETLT